MKAPKSTHNPIFFFGYLYAIFHVIGRIDHPNWRIKGMIGNGRAGTSQQNPSNHVTGVMPTIHYPRNSGKARKTQWYKAQPISTSSQQRVTR
jgi:hypothetical protein